MAYAGISLQRISLGALIIALGLLVDDAMIAVEMMVARLEVGDPLPRAATYVYTSTAFPMLTGTLVTAAGFIPVGLNSSNAGEFTFTLFVVIGVSLLVSWIVAVLFTPLLGVTILPAKIKAHRRKGRLAQHFSRLLLVCMHHRWITIAVTAAAFALALVGMNFVQQQFFPSSDRDELIIDWNLPQNASISDTNAQIARFEREQLQGNARVSHWSTYVGPVLRGLSSRSMCRLRTPGLARSSSSPRAASRCATASRRNSKRISEALFRAPIHSSSCLRSGLPLAVPCSTG